MFFSIPCLWENSTVYILGGGPSLLDQDLSLIYNKRVIGVNQAYKLGNWIDVCWYGDKQWYPSQLPNINSFKGLILTCSAEAQEPRRYKNVNYIGRGAQSGIYTEKNTHIAWNGNSGASAVNVAWWFGADRVVLIGFDCQLPEDKRNGRTHWHDDYGKRINKRTGQLIDNYSRFLQYWPKVKKDADKLGLEIYTTTPNSGLKDIFEYKPLEDLC